MKKRTVTVLRADDQRAVVTIPEGWQRLPGRYRVRHGDQAWDQKRFRPVSKRERGHSVSNYFIVIRRKLKWSRRVPKQGAGYYFRYCQTMTLVPPVEVVYFDGDYVSTCEQCLFAGPLRMPALPKKAAKHK